MFFIASFVTRQPVGARVVRHFRRLVRCVSVNRSVLSDSLRKCFRTWCLTLLIVINSLQNAQANEWQDKTTETVPGENTASTTDPSNRQPVTDNSNHTTVQQSRRLIIKTQRHIKPVTLWQRINATLVLHQSTLTPVRRMSGGAWVVTITGGIKSPALTHLLSQWQKRALIEYATYDHDVLPTSLPNDTLFDQQWQLGAGNEQPAALNVQAA